MSTPAHYPATRTFDSDMPLTILGVEGRLKTRSVCGKTKIGCWEHQEWVALRRNIRWCNATATMVVHLSFDDDCHNGHNTFAITANIYDGLSRDGGAGGCLHEEIAKHFPELAPLIKWHLVSTDGPMHYPGNVTYFAGDRDCYGLAKGEKRQILASGKTPLWHLRADATDCALKTALKEGEDIANLPVYCLQDLLSADECPTQVPKLFWEPCWRVGEGKARDLGAARSAAVWPEATDEQLCLPKEELTALLEARLPKLMLEFRTDMGGIGFYWSPEEWSADHT